MKAWRDMQAIVGTLSSVQRRELVLGAALAAATVLMGMGLLGVSGWFITATALAGMNVATAIGFDVFVPSAGIRLLALGRTGVRYAERLVTHDATFGALAALRERLFRGWARPDAARRLLARPARLLFRLTADIDSLESIYLRLAVPAGAALGAALLAGTALALMNFWMGLSFATWLIAMGSALTWSIARRATRPAVRRALAIEALRARAVDLVSGQTELLMAGRLDAQRDALATADRRLAAADLALNRIETQAGLAHGVVATLGLVGVLVAVGVLVGEGAIGAPMAALALLITLTATEPFGSLRRGALDAARTWLAMRRLAPCVAADPPAARAAPAALPDRGLAVELVDVDAAHPGSRLPTLQHLSLTLVAGEHVALIGCSGAGKSTLLAVMAGELLPRSGRVLVQPHSLLTQRTELFCDSLGDNLRLADPGASDGQLRAALQAAGLALDVRAMADGLDTALGEGGQGLSGGQLRRLALARLLLRDVPLWLLDEPTEALDPTTAHDVLQRLRARAVGRTLLIATHLRREASLADRLLCMAHGRIVADLRRGAAGFDAALSALRPD
ncbi:MAG: putative thiol reductant exporter, CydC subunit [Rhizobacter sp.]|nr:putative thiol reductant exporter, CydC subunit [Rhizobacter sp.]